MRTPTMGAFRLASLQLEGFKSFAGRVELSFPAPMTAIVGPNGAGKSNICDAIAWVLGEQSARLLRSQNMSEVIFAGSPRRTALGAAEVVLHMSADDGRWADTGGLLQISRRVFSSGASEYRINGRRARLKDVVDQLMDAGLGTRSYAIIEQGRIGQVLAARAVERRVLFEEAAGITKFRSRRHEAELKLAETRANLTRMDDVAAEVRRSLESVRRQARRAERALHLRGQLRTVREGLFAVRRQALEDLLAEQRTALLEVEAAAATAAAELGRRESDLGRQRRSLEAVQERLAAARADEARCDGLAQRREAEEAAARREHAEAAARADGAAAEAARLALAVQAVAGEGEALATRVQLAQEQAQTRQGDAEEAARAAGNADQTAQHAAQRLEAARRAVLATTASASEARNRVHRLEVECEQAGFSLQRLAAEQDRLREHHALSTRTLETATTHQHEAQAEQQQREGNRRLSRERHDRVVNQLAELISRRDTAAHQRWQTRHEHEGVRRALAASRAMPQVVARALPESAVRGTVADYLDPDPATAHLLDRALGDLLAAPVLADEGALATLLAATDQPEGRCQVAVASDRVAAKAPKILQRAVRNSEDLPWLSAVLPRVVPAADMAEAVRLATSDPDTVVVLPTGVRRTGNRVEIIGKEGALPGVLELRQRERELADSEQSLGQLEESLASEAAGCQGELDTLRATLATLEESARIGAEALAAASSSRDAAAREQARLQRELEALVLEIGRVQGEAATFQERLVAARAEAERLEERARQAEGELDAISRDAERAKDDAATARAHSERVAGEAALEQERATSALRDLDRHRLELDELRSREEALRVEVENQRRRASAAATAAVAARSDLEELLARRSAAGRESQQLADGEGRERALLAAGEELATSARKVHEAARDKAHAARLALVETQGARGRLEETIVLTLGGALTSSDVPTAESLPELERREGELATALEAIGPINELAVAERDELEERHRFLEEQRRDLEQSLASLANTVKELDAVCSERFLATLQEVNTSFAEVFQSLFGGGDATVELSDPDSPLDSGIEIRVRPPGKHTQSVLLLSGGEKALAAVALLLALFRIRPAPFCVLDEVDAPLDDANVERFCSLLRRMTAETQFLLITHNRRTMAHADIIYGVTMDEPGVSRTVSVRLEE